MLNPQGQELWLSFCVIENLSRPPNTFLYCSSNVPTVTFFWCHTSPQTAHLSSRFRPRGRLSQLLQPPNRAPRHRHWQPWKCRHRPKISGIYNRSCSESLQDFRKMSLHESSSKLEMSNSEMGTWIRQQGCLYPVLQLANISLQLNLHKSTSYFHVHGWFFSFAHSWASPLLRLVVHGLLYVAHWPMVRLIKICVYRGKIAGESPKVVVHWSEPTWNNKFKFCRGT